MIWRPLLTALIALVSYVTVFSYLICPHFSKDTTIIPISFPYVDDMAVDLTVISPFVSYNCHYISQINHQNIDKIVDDMEFNYKIYVAPHFSFFNQYYLPKIKLVVVAYYHQAKSYYDYTVSPAIHYYLNNAVYYLNQYFETAKLNFVQLKFYIINTNLYKSYQSTNFHRQGVLVVKQKVCVLFSNLFKNSHIKKFKEKKDFLVNELNNLYELNFGKEKINVDLKEIMEDGYHDYGIDDSDSDGEGPITVRITSTIYETAVDSVETRSPEEQEIEGILHSFEKKINSTLDLAFINISNEINPLINITIENLQGRLTESFKLIQLDNYNYYKEAHEMIKRIDKDLSNLKEYGYENYNETVPRQDMRDMISKIKEFNSAEIDKIEQTVNNQFGELVNKYLIIIQDTIDILETFMDSSFQDFQNKLAESLSKSDNEQYNWNTWKRFHNLRTLVLDKRDYIFDQANLLKNKKYHELDLDNDFVNWLEFLNNIDFHLSFISRDNEEYLQLIRAKANVSYQLREEAIREIEASLEADETETIIKTKTVIETSAETPVADEVQESEAEEAEAAEETEAEFVHGSDEDEIDEDVDFSDDPEVDRD